MKRYLLNPELPGGFGDEVILSHEKEKNGHFKVDFLHLVLDGWLGDDILECTPCFVITEALEKEMKKNEITGYKIAPLQVDISDTFHELQPETNIPHFLRMIPVGDVITNGIKCEIIDDYDICWNQQNQLVISEKMYSILKKHSITYCDVEEMYIG